MSPLLVIDRLEARNGDWRLGPVSLSVPVGCIALVGANGAGKSTLMRVLAGLQTATAGSVFLEGGVPAPRSLGYLPQEPELPGRVSVRQLIEYAAWLKGVPAFSRDQAVRTAATRVNLEDRLRDRVSALSGGMRRRAALAQAIVHRPRVLLLDEPTVGLDPVQRLDLRELVRSLATESAVVVSTHLTDDVNALASEVLVLGEGKALFHGSTGDLARSEIVGGSPDLERALWKLMTGTRRV